MFHFISQTSKKAKGQKSSKDTKRNNYYWVDMNMKTNQDWVAIYLTHVACMYVCNSLSISLNLKTETRMEGTPKGKSRDVNKRYQNWLRMHYKNKKGTRFSQFLLNLKFLIVKNLINGCNIFLKTHLNG